MTASLFDSGMTKPKNCMVVYCDGAAEPTNPGPSAGAYVLQDAEGKQIEARGYYLGHGSNNVAEYEGLIKGVEAAIRHGVTSLVIYSDSQLIVYQVCGFWIVKAEHLRPYREKVLALLSQIPKWDLQWIRREQNCQADVLANNAAAVRKDLDYTGREILARETPDRTQRTLAAAGDYQKRNGGQRGHGRKVRTSR